MPDEVKNEEYLAEAKRLAQLPVADQKEILALYRQCAANPKIPKPSGGASRGDEGGSVPPSLRASVRTRREDRRAAIRAKDSRGAE
jgi:hypothetical protein